MRLVRDRLNFDDFLWLLKGGFWGVLVVVGIVLTLGLIVFATAMPSLQTEHDIYAALREEKVDNETTSKTVAFLVSVYKSEPIATQQYRDILGLWNKEGGGTGSHVKIITEKWDNITLIMENAPEAQNINVIIPTWSDFSVGIGILFFIVLNGFLSVSYFFGSEELQQRQGREENILTYPWNKIWAYPFILLMLPFLILGQPILLLIFLVRKVSQKVRRARSREVPGQATPAEVRSLERPTIRSQWLIDADRKKYRAEVNLVKRRKNASRRQWISLCSQRFFATKSNVEDRIQHYYRRLVSLGLEIESNQRDLAEAKSELKAVEDAIKENVADATDCELSSEFDKLLEIPEILAIVVKAKEILVYTATLYVVTEWGKYELGDYLIRISTESSRIEVENRCNTSSYNRHHPYSYYERDTKMCFGKLSSYIPELQRRREYFGLIVSLLQVLQSTEGDNPENIKHWKGVA